VGGVGPGEGGGGPGGGPGREKSGGGKPVGARPGDRPGGDEMLAAASTADWPAPPPPPLPMAPEVPGDGLANAIPRDWGAEEAAPGGPGVEEATAEKAGAAPSAPGDVAGGPVDGLDCCRPIRVGPAGDRDPTMEPMPITTSPTPPTAAPTPTLRWRRRLRSRTLTWRPLTSPRWSGGRRTLSGSLSKVSSFDSSSSSPGSAAMLLPAGHSGPIIGPSPCSSWLSGSRSPACRAVMMPLVVSPSHGQIRDTASGPKPSMKP